MAEALSQKRFLWGVLLAWAPWVPTWMGLAIVLSSSKATGVAFIAAGLAELLVCWVW